MTDHHYIPIKGSRMTSYIFKVVVEPDEDKWSAYCPALLKQGAATWGDTEEEALKHIHEVEQSALRADSKRGYRWPGPRPHMNGNYLNIKHKKCKFLYDAQSALRANS